MESNPYQHSASDDVDPVQPHAGPWSLGVWMSITFSLAQPLWIILPSYVMPPRSTVGSITFCLLGCLAGSALAFRDKACRRWCAVVNICTMLTLWLLFLVERIL